VAVNSQQQICLLRIVQRVIEPGDGASRIAKCRMRCDVLDQLSVKVDLAAVAKAFEILLTG
jgi:hypothetical protein